MTRKKYEEGVTDMKFKRRKRLICAFLALTLAMSMIITGCGEDKHGLSSKEPTYVTLWHYYNGVQETAINDLVTEFNNSVGEEMGIVVTAESKGNVDDLVTAIKASINNDVGADPMPSMVQCYLDTAMEIDEDGLLIDLDDYVSEDVKSEYIDSFIDEGIYGENDEWKIYPIAKSTEVMMLNKTDWDKFAADTGADVSELSTWEGIAKVAQEYYEWSGGKSFFGRDAFANYMIIGAKQLGSEIFQVDGSEVTLNFDEEVMRKLWDNYYVPYVKGYYTQVGRYRSDDVKLGEIISLVCSSSSASYFPDEVTNSEGETYDIDYMVMPVPNFEGTDGYAVQQGAGIGVIKSDEKSEYACTVFLQWFTEQENNLEFSFDTGYLPVKKDACKLEVYEDVLSDEETMTPVEVDTIKVAMEELEDYTLYTTKGFESSYDARNILGYSMIDLAVADRETIEEQISGGTDRNQALEKYLSDEYFEQWYTDTKTQLEECLK
jgi:multiple sugar transport system substrate-binding protein